MKNKSENIDVGKFIMCNNNQLSRLYNSREDEETEADLLTSTASCIVAMMNDDY